MFKPITEKPEADIGLEDLQQHMEFGRLKTEEAENFHLPSSELYEVSQILY